MELFYFGLGVASIGVITLVAVTLWLVFRVLNLSTSLKNMDSNLSREVDELRRNSNNQFDEAYRRVTTQIENTHRYVDSRFDKFENRHFKTEKSN